MILSNFIPDLRDRLNDNDALNGYRFSKTLLATYLNSAINQIRIDRTDSQYGTDGNRSDYVDLWEYTEQTITGNFDKYISFGIIEIGGILFPIKTQQSGLMNPIIVFEKVFYKFNFSFVSFFTLNRFAKCFTSPVFQKGANPFPHLGIASPA